MKKIQHRASETMLNQRVRSPAVTAALQSNGKFASHYGQKVRHNLHEIRQSQVQLGNLPNPRGSTTMPP